MALGAPLEYVRAQRLDGSTCSGVLLPTSAALAADVGVYVYESRQGQPTWVPWSELLPLHPERSGVWRYFERLGAEVAPPPTLHEVVKTYTGGVGPHIRIKIMYPRGNHNKPVELNACELEGREADLQRFVDTHSDYVAFRPRRDGERSVFFNLPDFGVATALIVHRRVNLQLIMARMAWENLSVHCVDGVEAWPAGHSLAEQNLVLFPVNVNTNHWVLIAADVAEHTLTCYDSMHGNNSVHVELISRYLQAESGSSVPWTTLTPLRSPTQLGGHDCGVFVCASAAQLLRGEPPSLHQNQVYLHRRAMALELHSGRVRAA